MLFLYESRDSIAGVVPRLPVERSGIRIPLGQEIALIFTTSALALVSIEPSVQCLPAFLPRSKVATERRLNGADNNLNFKITLFLCALESKERQSNFLFCPGKTSHLRCSVIHIVHSPTNALFIKLGKV
jgi:hypothetical protein